MECLYGHRWDDAKNACIIGWCTKPAKPVRVATVVVESPIRWEIDTFDRLRSDVDVDTFERPPDHCPDDCFCRNWTFEEES